MNSSPTSNKIKYVGLHVHAETIAVAIADTSGDLRSYDNIPARTHPLSRLFRAGELTSMHTLPVEPDEAIRDLVRGRLAAVEDLRPCRQRMAEGSRRAGA